MGPVFFISWVIYDLNSITSLILSFMWELLRTKVRSNSHIIMDEVHRVYASYVKFQKWSTYHLQIESFRRENKFHGLNAHRKKDVFILQCLCVSRRQPRIIFFNGNGSLYKCPGWTLCHFAAWLCCCKTLTAAHCRIQQDSNICNST